MQARAQDFMIKAEFFEMRAITEILYNQVARVTSLFKDYLIFDDVCEFLSAFNKLPHSQFTIVQTAIF